MACVWELEVIDFERRAWLGDVLRGGDTELYMARVPERLPAVDGPPSPASRGGR
jgi:hypothetical protein